MGFTGGRGRGWELVGQIWRGGQLRGGVRQLLGPNDEDIMLSTSKNSCGCLVGAALITTLTAMPATTGGALLSAATVTLVPTIVFAARLGKHERRRPVAALQLAPGGVALRF